ncbi:hypothetical protein ACLOJK_024070 [Asimina triloba]
MRKLLACIHQCGKAAKVEKKVRKLLAFFCGLLLLFPNFFFVIRDALGDIPNAKGSTKDLARETASCLSGFYFPMAVGRRGAPAEGITSTIVEVVNVMVIDVALMREVSDGVKAHASVEEANTSNEVELDSAIAQVINTSIAG